MKPIEVVPVEAPVTVSATAKTRHLCPFVDEVDHTTITMVWICDTTTVELHSLAAYLLGFAEVSISHEELVSGVFMALAALPGITVVSVAADFTTAGMDVEVSRAVPVHTVGA